MSGNGHISRRRGVIVYDNRSPRGRIEIQPSRWQPSLIKPVAGEPTGAGGWDGNMQFLFRRPMPVAQPRPKSPRLKSTLTNADYSRTYREKHQEKRAVARAAYYAAHREQEIAAAQARRRKAG